jgi:MerR family mercuric resistance operon transcriptional regulator
MMNGKRTIGKLAAEAGVGVETIRYYERHGPLRQPPRHGTARSYGDEALWRLRNIKVGQQCGLSLREMRNLLAGPEQSPNFCASIRAAAAQRIETIDQKIAELGHATRATRRIH